MWIGVQINNEHSGSVTVAGPFKVSGYLLSSSGQPQINSAITAKVASKTENGFTDDEGHFELVFQAVEPGGPYLIYLNQEECPKLSVLIEEDFAWNGPSSTGNAFAEAIERKRTFFRNAQVQTTQMVAANQVIVLYGTKAGLGVSSLVTVIARELYSQGIPVMVIEAARSGGSLIRMFSGIPTRLGLDMIPTMTLDEVGETSIAPFLIEIRKGLEILPVSTAGNFHGKSEWTPQTAKELYRWASRRSGYVVVDAGSDLTFPLANAAFWMANKIFPVAGASPVAIDAAVRFGVMAGESHWTRVIPGWIVRGRVPNDLEALTGIKSKFLLKDSSDWDPVSHGKITSGVKKSVREIIETAQVVIGGGLS